MNESSGPELAAIAAAAPVFIWSATLDGKNDWHSGAWTEFTGKTAEELRGDGWMRCVHPEDLDRCVGIRRASFDAVAPFSLDYRLRHKEGGFRWVADTGVPRLDPQGRAAGYVGSAVDVHERKALEENLAERTQALRLAERRQGQFLGMLSHELRNPLAPIANAASVLRTIEHSNPILVRLREILERQVGRLGRLVEELIDVTRSAQGQISLVRERVSIESIVQGAVARSHEKINAGKHRLDVDVPDERLFVRGDSRPTVAGDLANLIANAAKFSFDARAPSRSSACAASRRRCRSSVKRPRRGNRSASFCRTPSSCSRSKTSRSPARSAGWVSD